jgi:hypothetical protein
MTWLKSSNFASTALCFCAYLVLSQQSVHACLAVRGSAPASEDYVQSEQAVIFWDETHHTEHFIRQVDIRTDVSDIGFLVPTPSVPELVEVDPAIFQLAADVGHPKMVQEIHYHTPWDIFGPALWGPSHFLSLPFLGLLTGMSDQGPQPYVLSEKDVAGYHAVVLAADNADALALWLKHNQYEWTREDAKWLQPYIDGKWTITAFKLIKPESPIAARVNSIDGKSPMVTRALRMSFASDKPFYPYSEPDSKQKATGASPYGRALRVAMLSNQRMRGEIPGYWGWPGRLLFAGSPTPAADLPWKIADWLSLAKLDGQLSIPSTLTYWLDESNPRPGRADISYTPDPDQSTYRRTEIDYSLPALHRPDLRHPLHDLGGLLLFGLLPGAPIYCGWWVIRRNKLLAASKPFSVRESAGVLAANWTLGTVAVLMGVFQACCCISIAFFMRDFADAMPGKPLPAYYFNSPVLTPVIVGILFWTLIYCGVRTFRMEPMALSRSATERIFYRWVDYVMAGGAFLIGIGFSLAMIGVLIFRLMPER